MNYNGGFDSIKRNNEELHKPTWTTEINGHACEPYWTLWVKDTSRIRHGYTVGINNHFTSLQFKWMLNHSIDIFGLIDAGLALDKTKEQSTCFPNECVYPNCRCSKPFQS